MNSRWTVRVGLSQDATALIRTRSHGVAVGQPLDFGATAPAPSSFELMLGALGSDLVLRFADRCRRMRLPLDECEARVESGLDNELVTLGVRGETGSPAASSFAVRVSVTSPAPSHSLQLAWDDVLAQSPLVATLQRACPLSLQLEIL